MKKTLCVFAIGATLFTPMMANAADVKVYGRAHVSLDVLDNSKDDQELGLSSNSSRLGFKAEKEFDDLTVFAQIETEINFAQGSDSEVDWASRDTFVGLKGAYGQLKAGRFDTPFKAARGPVNFFGDMVGDIRNVTRSGNLRFDERNANTIEYQTPKFNGFVLAAAVALHNEASPETDKKDKAYDVALTYKEGPIDFAAAYEQYESGYDTRGGRDAFRVAAAYKLTPELNVGALYQLAQHDDEVKNPEVSVYGIAADYKVTPKTSVRGQYFVRDVDTADSNTDFIALGVEHRLDSSLRVYGNVATALNDSKANITTWSQGRSNALAGIKGEDATGFSVGMRYDF